MLFETSVLTFLNFILFNKKINAKSNQQLSTNKINEILTFSILMIETYIE
jgi:hypothetical protein